ncbi:MAG: Mini-ribonuclease 3 [Syntrophomonadaceae bacterium]|jgi:ribonuclease-3 family protein
MHKVVVTDETLNNYSPLVLAYIGDAVFELMVRSQIVLNPGRKLKDMHEDTVNLVKAQSQARFIRHLFPELTEDEQQIVKRGRNTQSSVPKNADVGDYRMSTGFEALLGYLYLKGDEERLEYLVNKSLQL